MVSTGVDYLPRSTNINSLERVIMQRYGGAKAYGCLQLIDNIITRRNSYGYYIVLSRDTYAMIATETGCSVSYVVDIVGYAAKLGYYDTQMCKKYNIATNYAIQRTVLVDVYAKRKVDELSGICKEYILSSIMPLLERKAVYLDYWNIKTNREEQSKKQVCKNINNEKQALLRNIESNMNSLSPLEPQKIKVEKVKAQQQKTIIMFDDYLKKFKELYPTVKIGNVSNIPDYVDKSLLIEKIDFSNFLKYAKNISLEWMLKKDNYNKIVAGNYDKYKYNKALHNEKCVDSCDYNSINRQKEDLSHLFDNLDDF